MKKGYLITLILIIILLLIVFITFDFINITNYFPFTKNYDWLGVFSSIVGGLVGGLFTVLSILISTNNEKEANEKRLIEEKEANEKRLIEEKKQNGYSYLVFDNKPIKIKISLNKFIDLKLFEKRINIVIAENVSVDNSCYLEFELSFKNINTNYPSAAVVNKLILLYDFIESENKTLHNKKIEFHHFSTSYKPVTLKNKNIITFKCIALINSNQLDDIKEKLVNSNKIDILADMAFVNPNNVITQGQFRSNLLKINYDVKKINSNEIYNEYSSINTYFDIDKIDYISK